MTMRIRMYADREKERPETEKEGLGFGSGLRQPPPGLGQRRLLPLTHTSTTP